MELRPDAEVRLLRLPQGVAIGKLEGAPCVFAKGLDTEQVRSLWEGWKRSYDEERNNLAITRDLYPGAARIVQQRVTALLGRLPQPVKILDLARPAAGRSDRA